MGPGARTVSGANNAPLGVSWGQPVGEPTTPRKCLCSGRVLWEAFVQKEKKDTVDSWILHVNRAPYKGLSFRENVCFAQNSIAAGGKFGQEMQRSR